MIVIKQPAPKPRRLGVTSFYVAATFALTLITCARSQTPSLPYTFTEAQRSRVVALLAAHPGWRLAVPSDNTDSQELKRMRTQQPGFEPYYVSRSSTSREPDFAIALVNDRTFKVFYFRWVDGLYTSGQEVVTVNWLNDGLLMISGDTLSIAPFASDEIFRFGWNFRTARMELIPDSSDSSE